MVERLLVALTLAVVATFGLAGTAFAKHPDAGAVSIWTFVAVLGLLAFLTLMYGLKLFISGGTPPLPPEEPAADHH